MIRSTGFRKFIVRLVSLSLLSIGFAQTSGAAMIGTSQVIGDSARATAITRVEALLARQEVAKQLQAFGVDQELIGLRVANMTQAELAALEGRLDQAVAGGDAIAIIGVVFLVLIILEFVGITDIFKSA